MFAPDLKAFSSATYNIVGEGITYKVQHTPQKNVLMNKKYELFLFPNPYFVRAWHAIYRSAWEKMGK